jgi:hypothetical protein
VAIPSFSLKEDLQEKKERLMENYGRDGSGKRKEN